MPVNNYTRQLLGYFLFNFLCYNPYPNSNLYLSLKHRRRVLVLSGGGLVTPLGGKTTPLFYILGSSVITLLVHKTCLYSFRLHCLYI